MTGTKTTHGWQPNETAPKNIRGYFLTGPNPNGDGLCAPCFGWWDPKPGLWAKWPHSFQPTLWHPAPELPERGLCD